MKNELKSLDNQVSQQATSSTNELVKTTVSSSRIAGFAQMSPKARLQALVNKNIITVQESNYLLNPNSLSTEQADKFIENCVGAFSLPLGLATNFLIDQEEFIIPMVVEESSVVAAASYGAKLARSGGGFRTEPVAPIGTAQIQFFVQPHVSLASVFTSDLKQKISDIANQSHPNLISRGGGIRDVELRALESPGYYVLHLHVDTCEAMGANILNTMAERIGDFLPHFFPCQIGAKILTNLTLRRLSRVVCEVDFAALERPNFSGREVAEKICQVWEFANLDPFRAVTHNKGVMNGIDPVVIATGNDWRAVEAGCHAYASLGGTYKPLTRWFINPENKLQGEIEVPIAVGTVGGVTKLHPSAAVCLKILGNPKAAKLSALIASVGLAQNLSAIRALGCEGIQKGHMALHQKNIEMSRMYDHSPTLSVVPPKS